MVHDAIAYAPYKLQLINQTYTAYELITLHLLHLRPSQKFFSKKGLEIKELASIYIPLASVGWVERERNPPFLMNEKVGFVPLPTLHLLKFFLKKKL